MTSDAISSLHIADHTSTFGLARTPDGHALGFRDQPRYALEPPYDPDDPWTIAGLSGGRTLGPGCLRADLLVRLPPGDYLVVRTERAPAADLPVLLGNESAPSHPWLTTLAMSAGHYAAIAAAEAGGPPATAQALLGVTVLNYTGASGPSALLVFPFFQEPAGDGSGTIVLPVSGELVLDAMERFSLRSSEASRLEWASGGAAAFAAWLTSSG